MRRPSAACLKPSRPNPKPAKPTSPAKRQATLHQRLDSADLDIAAATVLLDALESRNTADLAALANGQQTASSAHHTLAQSAHRAVNALAELATTRDPAVEAAAADLLAIAEHRRQSAAGALEAADRDLRALSDDLAALAAARAALAEHADAHNRYLQHEVVAGQLEARTAELATARQVAAQAETAAASAESALTEARAGFDPAALASARQARDSALGLVRQLAERSARMRADEQRLDSDVKALRQVRADLEAAQAGIARVTRLEDRTEFIRRLLRDAGPRVTEILLASVSDSADEIYSDIMGAPGGRLRWAADYDIVLGRGGLERRFGQLSGGEQMAAALAVRLALLRDLLNLDIAFFDEPTSTWTPSAAKTSPSKSSPSAASASSSSSPTTTPSNATSTTSSASPTPTTPAPSKSARRGNRSLRPRRPTSKSQRSSRRNSSLVRPVSRISAPQETSTKLPVPWDREPAARRPDEDHVAALCSVPDIADFGSRPDELVARDDGKSRH